MLTVLVPMAGRGTRFKNAGYKDPKPFINIFENVTMIECVIDNIRLHVPDNSKFIFICNKENALKYDFLNKVKKILGINNFEIIYAPENTEGAACTALFASNFIDSTSLMIANSDQLIDRDAWEIWYRKISSPVNDADGLIMTFYAEDPKWSFVRLDDKKQVIEVVEKKNISKIATAGIYWWKHGIDFIESVENMLKKNFRVNNEFYIAPSYNEMILNNKIIKTVDIVPHQMHGLGTPEDLKKFNNYILTI